MDQPKADKFSELSPVLELVYVMLTNMAKYMDVYATDIDAAQNDQYVQAKDAIDTAIRKFDAIYGLKSPASTPAEVNTGRDEAMFEDESAAEPEVIEPETPATTFPATQAPSQPAPQPYEFASGNDPESLKKAKQAVEELKTLFADMKKQEVSTPPVQAENPATAAPVSAPVAETKAPEQPVSSPAPTPTFVTPSSTVPQVSTPSTTPAPMAQPEDTVPAPVAPPAPPVSDAGDVDSILAELKKLQNKGSTQL